jgi:mannose-6-phosphate isomerase-like protein (cupin superfamily)
VADFVIRRWHLEPYPGDQAPPHVHHASDEGFCVVAGQLEVLVGAERLVLSAGEHVVVPAGTRHTFATVGEDAVTVLAVMTPEVDALVEALHQPLTDHERAAVWERHRSALAPPADLL